MLPLMTVYPQPPDAMLLLACMYSCFQGLVGRNMQQTRTITLLTSISKLLYEISC